MLTAKLWRTYFEKALVTLPDWSERTEKHKKTYYSQKKLPWKWLNIPGRHVEKDGTVRDWDGYIVVAAPKKIYPRGTRIMTSLWPGKVYDSWWMKWKRIDIYKLVKEYIITKKIALNYEDYFYLNNVSLLCLRSSIKHFKCFSSCDISIWISNIIK